MGPYRAQRHFLPYNSASVTNHASRVIFAWLRKRRGSAAPSVQAAHTYSYVRTPFLKGE